MNNYRTASVEIVNKYVFMCDMCTTTGRRHPAWALYNVFDGNMPIYSCGNHLTLAIDKVATRKR